MTQQTPSSDNGPYLNPASAAPKYFHFATVICQRFCNQPVGTVLPALTELAKRFSVSKETINRSMRYLAQRGYVKSERGRGTYILRDLRDALGTPVETIKTTGEIPLPTVAKPSSAGVPHSFGMILKSRSGIVSPDRNLAEIEIVAGLQHRLQREGIMLTTVVVDDSGKFDLEQQLVSIPSLSGYVIMTSMLNRKEIEGVAAMKRPTVVINEDSCSDILTCVVACEAEGVNNLVKHLYELGHRKIVYLSQSEKDLSLNRFEGFRQAVSRFSDLQGVVHQLEVPSTSYELLEEQTKGILKKYPGYTAYIGGATEVPHYFCLGLRAMGLTPGKEISVAGFGINSHEWMSIADGHDKLTTVIKPRYEMGHCAAEVLLGQSCQNYYQTGVIRIPTTLQEGTTTGKVYRKKSDEPRK